MTGGTAGRLRRDAERSRERILAAARRLYADPGSAVTHNEVARAAGVGVGTVYRRFPQREDLMRALFEDQLGHVAALAEAALAAPDPWQGLRVFLAQVVELQAADRGLQEYMLGPQAPARARASTERLVPVVEQLLERARARGQVRPEVTATDVALIPVMVGAVTERSRDVAPGLEQRVLAVALDGLRPAGEPLPGRPLEPEELGRVLSSDRLGLPGQRRPPGRR